MALNLSVVIPVWHEQERINDLIGQLRDQDAASEIIVVDGDRAASTLAVIGDPDVLRLTAVKGRGSQLAAGVAAATGDTILLLHADSRLPDQGLSLVGKAVVQGAAWGAFRLGIEAGGLHFRLIERGVDLRCRIFSLPYGDQGIFVRRSVLHQVGGIPPLPIMEDVALARRLHRSCGPCRLLAARLRTSARRWRRDGPGRRTLKNWWLLLRYLAGADPVELAREYR
ncbi:TIGR04283 family arsenosugar biosynthesis glycosyltransferase [Trichloromonas sp.]|uniref:TIGR04283 family arsenosugar biosynthesis glycosyltransferase n=1 Tax=Trichloromonas sp. TaxID=3069249 RepID=UPI002A4290C9|nr:TIGR04283 family arsenosugar biosynthesis glycosyltransferase [Trichloromonas sp.]